MKVVIDYNKRAAIFRRACDYAKERLSISTDAALAEKMGVEPTRISRFFADKPTNYSYESVCAALRSICPEIRAEYLAGIDDCLTDTDALFAAVCAAGSPLVLNTGYTVEAWTEGDAPPKEYIITAPNGEQKSVSPAAAQKLISDTHTYFDFLFSRL